MRDPRLGLVAVCLVSIGMISTAGGADILGPVPAAGPPLRLAKHAGTPQHLDMSWGDSCGPDQNDFAVYEGTIGNWYSHTQKLCTTGGALSTSDVTPQAASSYYLIVAESTTTEGSYGTNSVGAELPVGATTCRAAHSMDACAWKRVFVSSVSYAATLGGLSGADANCQALADAATLGGTWKAWLSDSVSTADLRLSWSTLSYRRMDGARVGANGLNFKSPAHQNPINLDENGSPRVGVEVWTGTGPSGGGSGGCTDWTSSDIGATFPPVGLSNHSDSGWSNIYLQTCDRLAYLYCIEQ